MTGFYLPQSVYDLQNYYLDTWIGVEDDGEIIPVQITGFENEECEEDTEEDSHSVTLLGRTYSNSRISLRLPHSNPKVRFFPEPGLRQYGKAAFNYARRGGRYWKKSVYVNSTELSLINPSLTEDYIAASGEAIDTKLLLKNVVYNLYNPSYLGFHQAAEEVTNGERLVGVVSPCYCVSVLPNRNKLSLFYNTKEVGLVSPDGEILTPPSTAHFKEHIEEQTNATVRAL